MRFCGKCGGEIADDARFCEHCGAPVDRQGEETTAPEPKKKSSLPLVVVLLALLAVIAVGAGLFLLRGGKGDSASGKKAKEKEKTEEEKAEDGMGFDELEGTLTGLESSQITFVSADVSEFPKVKLYVRCEDAGGGEAPACHRFHAHLQVRG